jgi:hypothetical protein
MKVVTMDKKIIIILAIVLWCFGCISAGNKPTGNYSQGSSSLTTNAPVTIGASDLIFDPVDASALPNLRDLPFQRNQIKQERARRYTGIIKNKTRYEVSLPSENSDATLIIPPYSWIEYTAWTKRFGVTAYHNGKPFYCLTINAHPKNYPFMCRKYDFMAEIVKPEPVRRYKPLRKRRIKKRRPKVDKGVKGLG